MERIREFIASLSKPLKDVGLFILITLAFHFAYRAWNQYLFDIPTFASINLWLTDVVYEISYWINIHLLGFKILEEANNTMRFSNQGYIAINESCSGFKQFYQVFFLFLLLPGSWKNKAWFIPLSIFAMFLTNILRIIGLSIVLLWIPQYWDFCHDWIFRPFFYLVIFALWLWWIELISTKPTIIQLEN